MNIKVLGVCFVKFHLKVREESVLSVKEESWTNVLKNGYKVQPLCLHGAFEGLMTPTDY